MSDLKVKTGDTITATKWNRIVDRLEITAGGFGGGNFAMNRTEAIGLNSSGSDRDTGDILAISSYGGPTELRDVSGAVDFTLGNPTWHTNIHRLVVCAEPIPDGERGVVVVAGFCLVAMTATAASSDYVMISSTNTSKVTGASAGIAKLYASFNGYGLVNLGDRQPLWRYELTQDSQAPSTTTAKLIDLDGTTFATSINLTDPDSLMGDQVSGNDGWCIHSGNKFYAIQAVCA